MSVSHIQVRQVSAVFEEDFVINSLSMNRLPATFRCHE